MTKQSDVRDRILETAGRLFYSQGYNSTGTNQIIAESMVAKASLYQHFPSKEDLLVEYLRITSLETLNAITKIVETKRNSRDKIKSVFEYLNKFSKENNYNGCAFLNIASEVQSKNTKALKLIQNQKNNVRNIFKDILTSVNREELADQLYLLFEGALVASKIYKSNWPIVAAQNCALKMI